MEHYYCSILWSPFGVIKNVSMFDHLHKYLYLNHWGKNVTLRIVNQNSSH